MIYIEALMISITVCVLITASYIDLKSGIIPNKVLIYAAMILLPINIIYYLVINSADALQFIINIIVTVVISLFLYFINIWAAGDSKLLIVTIFGLPARLTSFINTGLAPCFVLIICVFSAAFICIMAETLLLFIKDIRNKKFSVKHHGFTVPSFKTIFDAFISYIFVYFTMTFINLGINWLTSGLSDNKRLTILMIDFMIALIIFEFKKYIPKMIVRLMAILYCIALAVLIIFSFLPLSYVAVDYKSLLIVMTVLIFRLVAGRYNYKEISTEKVSKWMIPSAATVIKLNMAKGIENLPHCLSEDRRARLTEEQVEAIQVWRKTKLGEPIITIVRKIPFAIFILIGTIIFLGLEILSLWFI